MLTDLVDVHRWWVAPGIDQYVVPTDGAAGRLHRLGVPPSKIAVLGIPLRREFGTTAVSAREMRSRLGLDPDLSTVLLMGGGDGAGRLVATARAIGALAERGGPRSSWWCSAGATTTPGSSWKRGAGRCRSTAPATSPTSRST